MNKKTKLVMRSLIYRLARMGIAKPPLPINLTLSVTNKCQSRCKTCSIWRLYKSHPARAKDELSLEELERIFSSMGEVYFFNVSGGEPFLRSDLPQIIAAACRHLRPAVIHVPTNALAPGLIEEKVQEILEIIRLGGRPPAFTIKPSLDGVGQVHDQIRGVDGNFDKLLDTLARLKRLKEKYPNLEIGVGTIISKYNLSHVRSTAAYAANLGLDSYISEIAEERTELFNIGNEITPSPEEYAQAIDDFNIGLKNGRIVGGEISHMTLAVRQVYYRYAIRILREKRQVLPCYAGIANVHISPYGDVWPCCVLGYAKSMGNLREFDYDFMSIWHSSRAQSVREYITRGNCYCPLANQAYSNILCNIGALFSVLLEHRRLGGRQQAATIQPGDKISSLQ